MREIPPPKLASKAGFGSFGTYFRISKARGLKVFRSGNLKSIQKECEYLNMASAIGLAPKCYEIVKVKYEYSIKFGIIVEHISGRHGLLSDKKMLAMDDKLRAIGIAHRDLTGMNIITNKGISKIVDFSPYGCRMIKKR